MNYSMLKGNWLCLSGVECKRGDQGMLCVCVFVCLCVCVSPLRIADVWTDKDMDSVDISPLWPWSDPTSALTHQQLVMLRWSLSIHCSTQWNVPQCVCLPPAAVYWMFIPHSISQSSSAQQLQGGEWTFTLMWPQVAPSTPFLPDATEQRGTRGRTPNHKLPSPTSTCVSSLLLPWH